MKYVEQLRDGIGNLHPRKNTYLLELATAQSRAEKARIKRGKEAHPYVLSYKAYKSQEKKFVSNLKTEQKTYQSSLLQNDKLNSFRVELFKAKQEQEFYHEYVDLDYEAELKCKIAQCKLWQIPDIMQNQEKIAADLAEKEQKLAQVTKAEIEASENAIAAYKAQRKQELKAEITEIRNKRRQRLISAKACVNEIHIAKLRARDEIAAKTYSNPQKSLCEEISNLKHRQKVDFAAQKEVLWSDISDARRKTPVEVTKTVPVYTILGVLFPGLGQLCLGQYVKSIFYFLGTIFTYFIALPYALGYGNYQGEGVFGLISLAEDGARLDRSIIFMIEGVIAILFLIITFLIFAFSFRDVKKTEVGEMKGVRIKNWFESRQMIESQGFPYLVSTPAYILVAFIVLIPIVTTLLISFTNMDPDHQTKFSWISFANYALILQGKGIAGSAFWLILKWTVLWTLGATTLAIAIGFVLSLIVNQERIKGKKFFRTIYILPWAVPAFITIMFFSIMVARNGPLTELINQVFNVSLDIKNDTVLTRWALIMLQGWLGSSYIFLLSTGVLQGIPKDLYEAAEIDGAKGLQKTLRITIPLVLFQTAPLLINQYTFNFNNFSIIYLFNQGGPFLPTLYGNLAGSSDLLISYIYKLTIEKQNQAIGAGITILISLVLMLISFIGYRRTAAFKED